MRKLFILTIFFLMGSCPLRADEAPTDSDQEFMSELDSVKNPFDDGLPKQVVVVPKVVYHPQAPQPVHRARPRPVAMPVVLPDLHLQGVLVGDDMHEAIINDREVPLFGTIEGARVTAVTKQGVALSYKGKKFFLKVE